MSDFDVLDKHLILPVAQQKVELANNTTDEAIKEGIELLANPSAPRYSSMDELKAALEE